jgi:hypothetical protein
VPQNRLTRLRMEVQGDTPAGTVLKLGRSGQAGGTLSVSMTFNARTTSGTTAT